MGMATQIIDAGRDEPRALPHGWGGWHLTVLAHAVEAEGGQWRDAFAPGFTFTQWHGYEDPDDGERLELRAGDTFRWWWT